MRRHIDRTWRRLALKVGVAAPAATLLAALLAAPAAATIVGPCHATGYSSPASKGKPSSIADAKSSGTSIDLATSPTWHVPSYKDYLAGEGNSDGDMSSGSASITAFKIDIPVRSGSGSGHVGSGGPLSVGDYIQGPPLTKVVDVSGQAQPDPNSKTPAPGPCQGDVTIVFDDVNPNTSVIGLVSIVLMAGGLGTLAFNALQLARGV